MSALAIVKAGHYVLPVIICFFCFKCMISAFTRLIASSLYLMLELSVVFYIVTSLITTGPGALFSPRSGSDEPFQRYGHSKLTAAIFYLVQPK